MSRVIFSPAAFRDLERLREFLRPKSSEVAKRAAKAIIKAVQILSLQLGVGRPADELGPDYRELPIDFGGSGYLVLYRQKGIDVVILALRHQLEEAYSPRRG